MGVDNVYVEPQSLRNVAKSLAELKWPSNGDPPSPADQLPLAGEAASNLNQNAQTLQGFQNVAEAQAKYLSETFYHVADAYAKVDENAATRIASADRTAAVDAIPIPPSSTQLPAIPGGPSLTTVTAGGYSGVMQTQTALERGDGGASLRGAASDFSARGLLMGSHAQENYPTNWEGDAADAAYARLNEYSAWLRELESAWGRLSDAANKLADVHQSALEVHSFVAALYEWTEGEIRRLAAQNDPKNDAKIEQLRKNLGELIQASEQVREEYAQGATFDAVKPSEPPFGSRTGTGSTGGGNGTGGGGGSSGATGATGAMMPASAGIQKAAQTNGTPEGGGTGSGGGSTGGGGGAPAGGGPQGGGAGGEPPGGMPDGKGMPTFPDDPSLHPAASGGGGSGGGGGGLGSMPLQPGLGAVGVGTGPAGGAGGGGAGPGAASAAGGMGGFAGGAPMHGAGHGMGGKEKKRNPALSPDENIYAEEREWTEPVIGVRRRKDVADTSKDST